MDTTVHGSGTDSFMRRFIDFETTPDAIVDAPAPEPAADPPAPEPAAEPALTLPPHLADPAAFASAVRETMLDLARETAPPPDPYANLPEFDAYDPESFRAHTAAILRAEMADTVDKRLEQLQTLVEPLARREGRAQAVEALTKIEGEIGSFDHDDAALRATLLIQQGVSRDEAVRAAAQQSRTRDEKLRVKAVEDYKASLLAMNDPANLTPSAVTPGADTVVDIPTGRDRYTKLVERHIERVNAAVPTG